MQSQATTVKQYLAELPEDRRTAIAAVRKVIRANLNDGFEEGMQYGMIGYYVPHRIYPAGYHCDPAQPLPFTCLASQKNYMSLYMMTVYDDAPLAEWFQSAWAATGKKLDRGKSCIRFRKLDDLPLEVIGEAIRRMTVEDFVAFYERSTEGRRKPTRTRSAASTKKAAPAKKAAAKRSSRSKS